MQGTRTAQTTEQGEVMSALRKENGGGYEHLREIPKPTGEPDGKLYDEQGHTISPATPTLMARLNEKSKDEFTITKGMAGIIVILLTAFGIFLGYIVPSIREGERESQKILGIEREVQSMSGEMQKLNTKFDDIQKSLQQQALKDAEKRGYELKAAEGDHK